MAIVLIGSVLLIAPWSKSDKTKRTKAESSKLKNDYAYIGKLPDLATKNYISETLEPESRLSWHKYFGEIGCQNIERIDPLVEKLEKKLQAIRFSRGSFNGPGLVHLKKFSLQGIIFDECGLNEESFKEIGQLDTLKELFLDGSKITDDESVSHLTALKNLYLLNLADTQITDRCFESLAKFPRLVQLNIRECPEIKGDGIERLTGIRILDISKTNFKRSNIKKLANLKFIIDLNLDGLGLSDKDLIPLLDMRLVRLNLKGSRITDKFLKRLIQIKSLKALNLVENKSISRKAITLLKQNRPDIELVHIKREKESFTLKELAGDEANIDFFEHSNLNETRK